MAEQDKEKAKAIIGAMMAPNGEHEMRGASGGSSQSSRIENLATTKYIG